MDTSSWIYILVTLTIVGAEYPSPLVFIRFNGNGKDLARTLDDPTIRSDVSFTTGPNGETNGAIDFSTVNTNTVGPYISYDVPGGSLYTSDHTTSLWVKNVDGALGPLVTFTEASSGGGYRNELWMHNDDQELLIRTFQTSNVDTVHFVENQLTRDEWVHISVTYDSTDKIHRVFRNAVQTSKWSASYENSMKTGPYLRLGRRYDDQTTQFRGHIACLQIYNVALDQRQLSQSASLCDPEFTALNPWPYHLGLWALDSYFEEKDVKRSSQLCHGTMDDGLQYRNLGPDFSANNSYEFRPEGPSYLEISNTNNHVSPKNSLTYSALVYHQHVASYPIFNYEYGTEASGTNALALHIWITGGDALYFCIGSGPCASLSTGKMVPYQWNFVALSYDFVKAEVTFYVNGEKKTFSFNENEGNVDTDRTEKIRIGRTFYDGDERFMAGRIGCIQMFDVNLNDEEIYRLKHTCEDKHRTRQGEPNGLVLMHPFNAMSKCRTVVPKFGHRLTNQDGSAANCQLVGGHRKRAREAAKIDQATYLTDDTVLPDDSSFTLMAYVRLEVNSVSLGFDSGPSFSLDHNGTLSATLTQSSDPIKVLNVYEEIYSDWVHLAVACNADSGACYIFGNSSFVGTVYLPPSETLATHSRLVADMSSGSVDIQCLQVYNRQLAQYEIEKAASRCYRPANKAQLPLPTGFWPLDIKYKTRELTKRNLPIVLSDTSDRCIWQNGGPFGNQGSLYLSTNTQDTCQGSIASNSASDVRHSFTIAAMVMIAPKSEQSSYIVAAPVFSYVISGSMSGLKVHITHANTDAPKTHTRVWSKKDLTGFNDINRQIVEYEKWYQFVFTCDYATGFCDHIVDRDNIIRVRSDYRDALTTYPVKIGDTRAAKIHVTCIQLYDEVLTDAQLKRSKELCDYGNADSSSYFMRLEEVPAGYGRLTTNSTVSVRSRMECIENCMTSDDCVSISYHPSQKTCKLSSLYYEEETGLSDFEQNGEDYLEFVHPLIAEAY